MLLTEALEEADPDAESAAEAEALPEAAGDMVADAEGEGEAEGWREGETGRGRALAEAPRYERVRQAVRWLRRLAQGSWVETSKGSGTLARGSGSLAGDSIARKTSGSAWGL